MLNPKFQLNDTVEHIQYGTAVIDVISQRDEDIVYTIRFIADDGAPYSASCGDEVLTLVRSWQQPITSEIFDDSVIRWLNA